VGLLLAKKVLLKPCFLSNTGHENEYGYGNDYLRNLKDVTDNGERLVTKAMLTLLSLMQAIWLATDDQLHVWVEFEATVKSHYEFTPERTKLGTLLH
jgi:hypothetical protein